MTHPVWKTAGLLGVTREDAEGAFSDATDAVAPVGAASMGAMGMLKATDLWDRRKSHEEFGSLEELIRRAHAQNPDLEIPDRIRLLQSGLLDDPMGLGYSALPDTAAKFMKTEPQLSVPWTLSPLTGLEGDPWGEVLNMSKNPAEAGAEAIKQVRDVAEGEAVAGRIIRDQVKYSPSAVLHELGHLAGGTKKRNRALYLASILGPMAGTAGGIGASFAENEALSYGAPAIAAAGFAPLLTEEARASINAHRMMKRMVDAGDVSTSKLRALKRALGPAYATYVAAAAIPTAMAAIIGKKMREKRERGLLGDVWAHGKQVAGDVMMGSGLSPEDTGTLGMVADSLYSAALAG